MNSIILSSSYFVLSKRSNHITLLNTHFRGNSVIETFHLSLSEYIRLLKGMNENIHVKELVKEVGFYNNGIHSTIEADKLS